MHDALFAMHGNQLNKKAMREAAEKIGLDMQQFDKDLASPATQQKLRKDLISSQKAGVNSTPSMFINGRPIKNRSPNAIQQMIDQELKKSHAAASN